MRSMFCLFYLDEEGTMQTWLFYASTAERAEYWAKFECNRLGRTYKRLVKSV